MNDGSGSPLPLFRERAVEEASSRYGAPIRPVGVASWLLVAFMFALVVAAVFFLASTQFARKETVSGMVLPSSGAIKLTALRPGVIAEVFVEDGGQVEAGTPVARISVDSNVGGEKSLGVLFDDAVNEHALALGRQLAARRDLTLEMQSDVRVRRDGVLEQIRNLREQIALEEERVRLAREAEASSAMLLEKELVTGQEHRQRVNARLMEEQNATRLRRELSDAQKSFWQMEVEQRRIRAQSAEEVARVGSESAELLSRKAQAMAQQDLLIVADGPGRITALQAKPGQPVSQGATIGVILPRGANLQVHLWVPSKAVGFLRPGDQVKVMYDAFPYQRFGLGSGRVSAVSAAPVAEGGIPLPRSPSSPGESLYEVKVAINDQYVRAYGKKWPLLAGMQLKADLVLERRSLLTWLFDPLRAASVRSSLK